MHRGTAEVVQWSKSTSGKIRPGCASGGLTLSFATHLVKIIMLAPKTGEDNYRTARLNKTKYNKTPQ